MRINFFLSCAIALGVMSHGAVFAGGFTTVDTVYTPPGFPGGDLLATLYIPSVPNGGAIVAAHPLGGTRATMAIWCDTLAARGYVAMAIEYPDPVFNRATFPVPPRALKTAVQFLRQNSAHFHIDPRKIGGLGQSMGSVLLGQSVILDERASYLSIDPAVDDRLDAAVLLYGLYDFSHNIRTDLPLSITVTASQYFQASSVRQDSGTCVLHTADITTPLLLIHGTADSVLQYEQSVELADSLRSHGKPYTLLVYPGQPHMFDVTADVSAFTPIGRSVKDSALAFYGKTLLTPSSVYAPAGLPAGLTLGVPYPNPVGATATIPFSVAAPGRVSMSICNELGGVVATLADAPVEAGSHQVAWHIGSVPNGVYLCQLRTQAGFVTREIVVAR